MSPAEKSISFLKKMGVWEGISYLVLLFVAMPMKYFLGMPLMVRVVGSFHGLLFVMFIYAIINARVAAKISIKQCVLAFLASIVPFGTFFLDKWVLEKK